MLVLRALEIGRGRSAPPTDGKSSDRVRRSVRPVQHGRGLLVTEELLGGRIPLERAAEAHREVAEVADRGTAVADLDVADRPLAALDAVEEVLMVVGALVKPDVSVGDRLEQDV